MNADCLVRIKSEPLDDFIETIDIDDWGTPDFDTPIITGFSNLGTARETIHSDDLDTPECDFPVLKECDLRTEKKTNDLNTPDPDTPIITGYSNLGAVRETIDLDDLDTPDPDTPVLTDLTNVRIEKCCECNDLADGECQSCLCQICFRKTTIEKRCRCSGCHKLFHGSCLNGEDLVSPTSPCICPKCKDTENLHLSTSEPEPLIQEIITKDAASKIDLSIVKSEKCDFNANSTINKSVEDDPSLDQSYLDIKHKIVEKVARRFVKPMHHASRTKECVVVPRNHFGPIPGVSVGTCWRFRLQVSECGVHRPLVGGIHGRPYEGAFSIVLSGVYDDDQDFGDEFLYCGSGGRAKDKSKRYSAQIADQTLDRVNRALALCCNAPLDNKNGGEAEDWRSGKPVRVVRNYRLRKHSEYAPEEGNRYDGIYKVVKYFPTKGKVGLIVWKFLMRRDDPEPAPWTDEGKRIIAERNLARVIWPDDTDDEDSPRENTKPLDGRSRKRQSYDNDDENFPDFESCKMRFIKSEFGGTPTPVPVRHSMSAMDDFDELDVKPDVNKLQANLWRRSRGRPKVRRSLNEVDSTFKFTVASVMSVQHNYNTRSAAHTKRNDGTDPADAGGLGSATSDSMSVDCLWNGINIKPEPYELSEDVKMLVEKDTLNKTTWEKICKFYRKKGEVKFLNKVKTMFQCRCCSKLLNCPVTTPCQHNICLECITDHFSKNLFTCPDCQFALDSSFELNENKILADVLKHLFPDLNSKSSEVV